MTSINTTNNSSYYQLLSQQQTAAQTTSATPTTSLADMLAENDDSSSNSSAYLMDLSPAAQAYLNNNSSTSTADTSLAGMLNSTSDTNDTSLASLLSGATNTSDSNATDDSSDTSSTFTITAAQQKTIDSILDKYKNAPYTQATFNDIQNDLKTAGLSSDELSAKDQISSFNATSVLMGYLDGSNTSATPVESSSDEQTKSTNFMQSVMSQWQSISTTASASTAAVS